MVMRLNADLDAPADHDAILMWTGERVLKRIGWWIVVAEMQVSALESQV